MSVFPPRPLGAPIPESPHAVSVSLPTMAAVRGYEEKQPDVVRRMTLGYPRFFLHPLIAELSLAAAARFRDRRVWLVSSAAMAALLTDHLNALHPGTAITFEDKGLYGVAHFHGVEIATAAKLFLQHVGGFLSSREAEDQLVRRGLRRGGTVDRLFAGDAESEIRRNLLTALPAAKSEDLFLTPNGMNAVFAAYRAVTEVQARRGRTEWIQLGWLYLDSIAILKKFSGDGAYHHISDANDLASLERLLVERGPEIAGVLTEVPTNPLIQTTDVERLAELCHRHGVMLVMDPSVASSYNVNILRHADLLVSSLTKYTGSDGDIIAGMVAVNPAGRDAEDLRRRLPGLVEPVYARDLGRLAEQIGRTREVLAKINAATPRVAEFLSSHPQVSEVHWALGPGSGAAYQKVQHAGGGPGGMISFAVRGEVDRFYDRLRLAKGPSFGMQITLICPFMYLAHYDLITTPAGRAELANHGLNPELLRLCVGTEPVDEIIAALSEAL